MMRKCFLSFKRNKWNELVNVASLKKCGLDCISTILQTFRRRKKKNGKKKTYGNPNLFYNIMD